MTTVLIVEDEVSLRQSIIEMLQFNGFTVHGAENGKVGLAQVQAVHPDVILCDIAMPVMDGFTMLLELRQNLAMMDIPFVFLTAFDTRESMRKGMRIGADDYLTKPFTINELLQVIHTQVERAQIRRELRERDLENLRSSVLLSLPHELRTPLSGVMTAAEMLLMDFDENTFDPERAYRFVKIIENSGNRLHHVIENYLIYVQIELLSYDPERLTLFTMGPKADTPGLLAQMIGEYVSQKYQREADFRMGGCVEAPVLVTEDNLRKILDEVIDNAFKFSDAGSPVEIDVQQGAEGIVLRVCDRGVGMKADQIVRIGPYIQFDRRTREQQGLGLGLTIARKLTELHGGRLDIESVPNEGTTIALTLPHDA